MDDKEKIKLLQEINAELLEVCGMLLKHLLETDFDVCGTPDWMVEKAKAAIKKATE